MAIVYSGAFAQTQNQGNQEAIQKATMNRPPNETWIAYVYPNPCVNDLKVFFDNKGQTQLTVKLTDELGNLVNTHVYGNLSNGLLTFEYDLSSLPAGNYFISVFNETGSKTLKLFKQ